MNTLALTLTLTLTLLRTLVPHSHSHLSIPILIPSAVVWLPRLVTPAGYPGWAARHSQRNTCAHNMLHTAPPRRFFVALSSHMLRSLSFFPSPHATNTFCSFLIAFVPPRLRSSSPCPSPPPFSIVAFHVAASLLRLVFFVWCISLFWFFFFLFVLSLFLSSCSSPRLSSLTPFCSSFPRSTNAERFGEVA